MIKHVATIALAQSNVDEKGSTETRRQRILGREALSPRMASTYLRPGLRSLMISRKMGEQEKKRGPAPSGGGARNTISGWWLFLLSIEAGSLRL